MALFLQIHPMNPQERFIKEVVNLLHRGGVIVYPTDSTYAFGCCLSNKEGLERIRQIRRLDKHHYWTLVCRNLSEISTYALVDKPAYRLLKSLTPGPYTFILNATREVPRRLQHPKRKTIGIRIPDSRIVCSLLTELQEPLMSCTLKLPEEDSPLTEPEEIYERLKDQVDVVIDGGQCGLESTSVIDLSSSSTPVVIREGRGDVSFL